MKRKILSYLLLFATAGMWSCQDNSEGLFDETADQRLDAALTTYQQELSGAPNGWKGIIYPGGGGSYSFYFKFDDKNRVVMYSDFDVEMASTPKESSYRLKAMQTPSLIFDTYSYLHVLADPDGGVNGGTDGDGLKSDYEFSFVADSVNKDGITLIGTKNQSRLVLTKASAEEAVAYQKGDLAKSLLLANIDKYPVYFKRITVSGVTYEINVNTSDRIIVFTWLDGSTRKTFTTNYNNSSTGVIFFNPLVNGSQTITGFTNLTWDESKPLLSFDVGSSLKVPAVGNEKPISPDLAAPKRWWQFAQDKGSYWISETGFRVGTVEDYFGISKIPNAYMLFFPAINVSGSTTYDALTAYDGNGLMGPAVVPTFTADGRITFRVLGTFGTNATLNTQLSAVASEANGFYLVQKSNVRYDMVSAKDGKTWISWWYPF